MKEVASYPEPRWRPGRWHAVVGTLLGIAVVVGGAGFFIYGVGVHPTGVTLSRGAIEPFELAYVGGGRHSARFAIDASASWTVAFDYAGCPSTRQGAFAMTLVVHEYGSHIFQIVDGKTTDRGSYDGGTGDYSGNGHARIDIFVEIPGRQGCRGWVVTADTGQ